MPLIHAGFTSTHKRCGQLLTSTHQALKLAAEHRSSGSDFNAKAGYYAHHCEAPAYCRTWPWGPLRVQAGRGPGMLNFPHPRARGHQHPGVRNWKVSLRPTIRYCANFWAVPAALCLLHGHGNASPRPLAYGAWASSAVGVVRVRRKSYICANPR